MLRLLVISIVLITAAMPARSDAPPSAETVAPLTLIQRSPHVESHLLHSMGLGHTSTATSQSCCKVCHAGKACGDTCISRNDTCRVGPGCACDG
jgi:hypothetical protein